MNKKKVARWMIVLTVLIGIAAIGVGYLAIERKQWIIAVIMFIVMFGQAFNFIQWKKRLK